MPGMARLVRSFAVLFLWLGLALPAQAAVTITFWSHEFGNSFPHSFITLRGTPDAGGATVDADYGFTAKSISPAILFGTVAGIVEPAPKSYIEKSDAQFSVVLSDAQYAQVLALIAAWNEKTGDAHYNLNNRNCVHFVKEAARVAGLAGIDQPKLMKKPRSFLLAVEAANEGKVAKINRDGKVYLASLPPIVGIKPVDVGPPATPTITAFSQSTPAPARPGSPKMSPTP